MDETDPALDPAHRPRELDRVAAQLVGRGGQTRGLLGMRHHRFEGVELARQPRGQTVGQQAEGGVALGAVPASNPCPARSLARIGAVACQRTSPVWVIRTALEACSAPRLGSNVFLAGKPRLIPKLHRPWPGGARLPARANSTVVRRDAETTAPAGAIPSGAETDASPSQAGGRLCGPSAATVATTSPPLRQHSFMRKATSPRSDVSRIAPSSQEIRRRNNPVKSWGAPTRQSGKQHQGQRSLRLKVIASNRRMLTGASSFTLAISSHCPSWSSNASRVRSVGSTRHRWGILSRA